MSTSRENSRGNVSGAILAGGQSRRMGRDKASLLIDREPLLLRVARLIRGIVADLAIIGSPEHPLPPIPDIPVIPDRWPDCGPLGGIATALSSLPNERTIIVACDMPFLNPALLRHLITAAGEADAAVARLDGQAHPLHAVYQRRCLPIMEAQLAAGDLRVHHFLTQINVRYVEPPELTRFDPTHRSVLNCNTPEEWQHALTLLAHPPS